MTKNFVVFYSPPPPLPTDLNVLIDSDKNRLYYYKRVANTLASVASL